MSGLQVLNKHGEFVSATPIEGAYVVNIGDLLQRHSNNYFSSTLHRVVNKSGRERYSAPYFFSFDPHELIPIAPTCVSEENPTQYEPITTSQYIAKRADASRSGNTYVTRS